MNEDTITMLERLQEELEEERKMKRNMFEQLVLLQGQLKQLYLAIRWNDDAFEKDSRTYEIDAKAPLMIWKGWTEEDFEGEWWL